MPEKIPTTKEETMLEVVELEEPLKKILEQIRSRIDRGEFGLIIGDDTSGRIPALILGNFIRKIEKEKGLTVPNLIFIPGGLDVAEGTSRYEMISERIKNSTVPDHSVLIVTEAIDTGHALSMLTHIIKKLKIPCVVATIGRNARRENDQNKNIEAGDIVSGEYNNGEVYDYSPGVSSRNSLSGVYKEREDLVSRPYRKHPPEPRHKVFNKEDEAELPNVLKKARENAAIITDRLVNWYKQI